MKKFFTLLLAFALVLSLCACGGGEKETGESAPPVTAPVEESSVPEEIVDAPVVSEEAPEIEETVPETPVAELPTVEVDLYLPNDNADGFNIVSTTLADKRAESIVAALVSAGALPEAVAVISCEIRGEGGEAVLMLDMNAAFGDAMKHTGTTGEYLYLGSLTNTLLGALGVPALELRVEGAILETGHSIYDFLIYPMA